MAPGQATMHANSLLMPGVPATPPTSATPADTPSHVVPTLSPTLSTPTSACTPVANGAGTFKAHLQHALRSVVKIFTTSASPNFSSPWQMKAQTQSTASGFVIHPLSERRILTNAHAVTNQVMVLVRKHGSATKFNARVVAVGHECDIAMLTVDDEAFWSDVEALEMSGLPPMQEEVTVVGFPLGGDNVCVTKGVVSRIDFQQYSHGNTSLLVIQIDAAINSGNSGGPVLHNGKVVGIAFQNLTKTTAENIGYIIPPPIIDHFLGDLQRNRGKYTGFCSAGMIVQTLENSGMKAFLRMTPGMTGVYVIKLAPLAHASKVLKYGDVVTHINGVEIADDATFEFQEGVRLSYWHLTCLGFPGDMCKLGVWRAGAALEVEVRLDCPRYLVPVHRHDIKPDYFIYAGLVFVAMSSEYMESQYGKDWLDCKAPLKLCAIASDSQQYEGQELVLLSKVMAADVNIGYEYNYNCIISRVNGIPVHSLAHLAQMVEACTSDFVCFDQGPTHLNMEPEQIIVDNAKARATNDAILQQNYVPAACSKGLLEQELNLPVHILEAQKAQAAGKEAKPPQEPQEQDLQPPQGRSPQEDELQAPVGEPVALTQDHEAQVPPADGDTQLPQEQPPTGEPATPQQQPTP